MAHLILVPVMPSRFLFVFWFLLCFFVGNALFSVEDFLCMPWHNDADHIMVAFFIYFSAVLQSKDPRFHALPLASQRVAAFADAVNELVYDVLISKVRQRLSDVSRLPIWSSVEEQSAFHLPTFSAYPQTYVTSVGEYLLTLPQQLEPLAEGISTSDNNDEAQFFATEWMFKVTSLYPEEKIQLLNDILIYTNNLLNFHVS